MRHGTWCRRLAGLWGLAALMLVTATASAQVYKCVAHDGKTTYGDQPCRGAATSTQLAVEPNVIDTAGDRLLRELAEMTPQQIRQQRPAPECDRAVQGLERARRGQPPDAEATRTAYQAVIEHCRLLGPGGSPASRPSTATGSRGGPAEAANARNGVAPTRDDGSAPRAVALPLPPGATDRGTR